MKLLIAPSLLAADFAQLGAACRRVLDAGADVLHVDVMDGCFVPNLSLGLPVLASLHKALPNAVYDVHLMIENPLQYVNEFARAGATWLTFHCEAASPVGQTIDAIHAAGMRAGVSLKPATPVSDILPWLDKLDLVLVMSVEPGFGGQAFLPGATEKIAQLRSAANARGLALDIEVDGGIDARTGAQCAGAGANIFVAGSAVFGASDCAAAVRTLRAACEAAAKGGPTL